MQRRTWYFLIGAFSIGAGISGLISGELPGIGARTSSGRWVTFSEEPIEFTLMLLVLLGLGGSCIWAFFFEERD
jgi:hypothetical protein